MKIVINDPTRDERKLMADRGQSEESNLNATPTDANDMDRATGNSQWQETSLDATPTNPSTPAAASDGESAAAPRSKFTLHQKVTLLSVTLTAFSTWSTFAIISVFFASEAEKKGMSKTVVGLVFSCYSIAAGISAPMWGKLLPYFDVRFVFLAGAFVTGGCNMLLGFVEDMPTLGTFTGFSFAIRTLEGLGSSACNTAIGAILAYTFPDNVGFAVSVLETVTGASFALGPVIGGLLYNVGGFKLPFFVVGGFVWGFVAVNYFLMPVIGRRHEEAGPMGRVLKLPAVWVVLLANFWSITAYSAMDPVLAVHLKKLGFSVTGTTLVFAGWGSSYALTALVWGYIVDKKGISRIMMVLGAFAASVSFLLIGPAPFLNIPQSMPLIAVALPTASCVVSMIVVPAMPDIFDTTTWYGIPYTLGLNAVVSGLWNAATALGSVLGPMLAGFVTDYYGFEYTTTVFACGFLVVVLNMCVLAVWEYRCGKGRRRPKRTPVVEASSTEEEKTTLLSKEA